MPRDGYAPFLVAVLVLPVVAFDFDLYPAIVFYQFNDIAYFWHGRVPLTPSPFIIHRTLINDSRVPWITG